MIEGHSAFDLVIIGAGATGLSAALEAGRHGLRVVVLESEMPGGWLVNADLVEDYPGIPEGIPGVTLAMNIAGQVEKLDVPIRLLEVTGIEKRGGGFLLQILEGAIATRAAIVASGAAHKRLGVPGEERLEGSGISYCATCDGPLFRNQAVAVIGGDDGALRDALYVSQFAARVAIVHSGDRLEACHLLRQKASANPRVEIHLGAAVESISGDTEVTGLQLTSSRAGNSTSLAVSGVFVSLGGSPNTGFLGDLLALRPAGAIPTNSAMETEIPGLFAAGAVREGHLDIVALAVAEGILASLGARRFLESGR